MQKKLHLLTFWAINDALDTKKLKEQLKEMQLCGYDGTIFHPRYYPEMPPYMGKDYLSILSEVILYAKEIGMSFWIYDENGWPSGCANGKVKAHFPDRTCDWLIYQNGDVKMCHHHNFNTLDREQMQYFIDVTFEAYRKGLNPEAFDYIEGFFSDEVEFLGGYGGFIANGGIPWCQEAEDRMKTLLKKDNLSYELLFTEKEGYKTFRYQYWQTLTDILSESFYEAINSWCEKYNKRYTAHLKGEENIFFQIPHSGSCYTHLQKVNMPAVDALERYPINHYYPRIVSSLSRQFGDGNCLVEALAGSGWGLAPEDLENYVEWLAESGINYFTFHLWQYRRNASSMRDWPPNIPCGLNWKDCMKPLTDKLREKWNEAFNKQKIEYLIVAPVRGCMSTFQPEQAIGMNDHNGTGLPATASGRMSEKFGTFIEQMYESGLSFDVTDERTLEKFGKIQDGLLHIGNAVYTHVILGEGCLWEHDILSQTVQQDLQVWQAKDFKWHIKQLAPDYNQLPLLWQDNRVIFKYTEALKIQNPTCYITFSDKVKNVFVNDIALTEKMVGEFPVYDIPQEILWEKQTCVIEIRFDPLEDGEKSPFAFFEGNFLVKNTMPYQVIDQRMLQVEGEFYLDALENIERADTANLTVWGLPFAKKPVKVLAKAYVGPNGTLKLGKIAADCVKVEIDGKDYGYIWRKDWCLNVGLTEGIYEVTLTLIPSTYNANGPHHYLFGDHFLISPLQYGNKKSFVEPLDAPEEILVPAWHFVKFGIGY
jgi:hypothetical protein